MTAAIAVGYFGASILWSDHVRRQAYEFELRLLIEEEKQSNALPNQETLKSIREKELT